MSSEDRVRLVEHADSHHDEQEKLGTERGSQAIHTGGSQVRFSSRSPQLVMANKTAPRQAHQNGMLAEVVYGDGNVFVTDEPVKRARSCNYVRAVIAILMLPLFVLLILAITGILPIGWGTHDVPSPPPATDAQRNELQNVLHQQAAGHQTARVPCKKLGDQQMLNHVQNQIVESVNSASPREVQQMLDTALNGALQVLNSAGGKEKPVDGIEQAKALLADEAIRNAAQKALSEAQQDPDALLKAAKKIENAAGGAELTAAKLSDAIKPGVMGPNDDAQPKNQNLVPVRAEPVMEDAPIMNKDEFDRMVQNALRRRGSP